MNRDTQYLLMMVSAVTQHQNCVLEVIMGESGIVAHLIPLDQWGYEDDYEEDEDE